MAKVTDSRRRSTRSASKRPTSSRTRATRSRASSNSSRTTTSDDRLNRAISNVRPTQGRGVLRNKEVNSKGGPLKGTRGPARAPLQGPRTAPQQGTSSRFSQGLIGSRPETAQRTSNPAPRPRGGDPTKLSIRKPVEDLGTVRASLSPNPYAVAAAIIASDIKNRSVADGTLDGKPVPEQQGPPVSQNRSQGFTNAKENGAVLAKQGGQTGSMINGSFFAHPWSAGQRMRYAAFGGR